MTNLEQFYQNLPFIIKAKLDYIESQEKHREDIEYAQRVRDAQIQWYFVNYNTKTQLKQAITQTNKEINHWMEKKRKSNCYFWELNLEECLEKKKRLKKRLDFISRPVQKGSNDKETAKSVPIEHFLKFNNAGFAKCVWHTEKTGSLHKIPNTNLVYCFSCQKKGDTIDIVMAVNGCDFPSAIKLILNK